MNFTHLTWLMLLYYIVKVKKHWKCNITAGYYQTKLHQMYHSFSKVGQAWNLLIWVLYSKACMKQRWFMTSMTCENAWCKTFFDRNIIDAGVTIWDHVYIMEVDTMNTSLAWMFIYMIHQHILWNCQCNLMRATAILKLALKAEVVFTCIFGFSTFTRLCSSIN